MHLLHSNNLPHAAFPLGETSGGACLESSDGPGLRMAIFVVDPSGVFILLMARHSLTQPWAKN